MISFAKIMRQVLTETMSFMDLWRTSDPARKVKSKHVKTKSLGVDSIDGQEAWIFSYKSDPAWSTTGTRWQGYVQFLKENVENVDSAKDLQCMVDCSCPDYRFRWAYANNKAGASPIGNDSLNGNNGSVPTKYNLGTGMCKHLLALGEYLRTQWEPVAPTPEVPIQPKEPITHPTVPLQKSKVGVAPEPPKEQPKPKFPTWKSPYSDSRSGDLMENKVSLKDKIGNFIRTNPKFEVKYEDE